MNYEQTNEILAYTAGLLDGEGCISLSRRVEDRSKKIDDDKYRYIFHVVIVSTDVAIMDFLFRTFGGGVYKQTGGLGKKKCWKWQLNGKEACEFLKKVYPYARIKRNQVTKGIAFGNTIVNSRHEMTKEIRSFRDFLYGKLKGYNSPLLGVN